MNLKIFIALFWLLCASDDASAQLAIITNESVSSSEIDVQQLVDIFSLEENKWPDGTRIVPVDLKGKNEIKQSFYKFLGRSPDAVKRSRLRIILAGEGDPPILMNSAKESIETIKKTRGAIGYVPLDLVPSEGVLIVATFPQ